MSQAVGTLSLHGAPILTRLAVVPTSDPHKLLVQITGNTYQDKLDGPLFRRKLTDNLHALFKDKQKTRNFSSETLPEVLRFVRRGPLVPDGATQWYTSVST